MLDHSTITIAGPGLWAAAAVSHTADTVNAAVHIKHTAQEKRARPRARTLRERAGRDGMDGKDCCMRVARKARLRCRTRLGWGVARGRKAQRTMTRCLMHGA